MLKRLLLVAVILVLVGSVSAVIGGKCEGNTLVYYDVSNNVIRRDCSILHSGSGEVYRGICKLQVDRNAADCYRTEGGVTPEYRDAVRGVRVNDTDPWGDPYEPPSVTTTTLPLISVSCPVCDTCEACEDCSRYKVLISSLNTTSESYRQNMDAYRAESAAKIDRGTFEAAMQNNDRMLLVSANATAGCLKDKAGISSWNDTYMAIAALSVGIMLLVVYIWVKYEFLGSRFDDPFAKSKSVSK